MQYPAAADAELIQIVDAALANAAERSGDWLACRPGCSQCCVGIFPISQLDAARLQAGFGEADHPTQKRIALRVEQSLMAVAQDWPGDFASGLLDEQAANFDDFANDVVCPVLDPTTGTCDLYSARPMTCRTFGPPVQNDDGSLGVCELCFLGAPESAVTAAEMNVDFLTDENRLSSDLGTDSTTVAHALRNL